jgi:hypothetical protein
MNKQERLNIEFDSWNKLQTPFSNNVSSEHVKEIIIKELEFLSKMSVEEYTLYRKWQEIQYKYPIKHSIDVLGDIYDEYAFLKEYKKRIWIPKAPEDFKKIEPEIILCDNKRVREWNILRTFTHTMINNSNIGRQIFFIVIDRKTKKYLGILCLSSDFLDLTPRDDYIGWDRKSKTERMINYTAIGSTIVPTQPLGYSFVGGKFLALLLLSKTVEDCWNNKYGKKLVGITTTSLYSSYSQYQNLSYWNKRGHSEGTIKFEPSKETVNLIRSWLKHNYPREYFEWYVGTRIKEKESIFGGSVLYTNGQPLKRDHKQRSLSFVYNKLNIPRELIETNHQRGIYFCTLFENTCEFLREEITDANQLKRRFDNSVEALTDLWKEKYAIKRVNKLIEENRYSTETLFYSDLIGLSWEDTKKKYLKEVGR